VQELLGVELIDEVPAGGVSDAHPRIADVGLGDATDQMEDEVDEPLFEEESRTEIFAVEDDATGPSPDPAHLGIPTETRDTKRSSLPADPPDDADAASLSSIPPAPAVPDLLRTTVKLDPETSTGVELPPPMADEAVEHERVTVEERVEDPDLVTAVGAEPLTPVNSKIGVAPQRSSRPEPEPEPDEPQTIDEPEENPHEARTVVAQALERDTIPAPAPDEPVSAEEMLSSAVQSLPAFDDEEEDGTVVTAFGDDLTKPIDSDSEESPRKKGSGQGRHRG
jgi:hypothetical protein